MSEPFMTGPDEPPYAHFVGRTHEFPDGVKLHVVQVKQRHDGMYVTYETQYPASLPRRFVVRLREFHEQYNHLFA